MLSRKRRRVEMKMEDAADYEFENRAALEMTWNINILKLFDGLHSLIGQETTGFTVMRAMVESIPIFVLSHCTEYFDKTREMCNSWDIAAGSPTLPLLVYLVSATGRVGQCKVPCLSEITKEEEVIQLLCDNFEKSEFQTNLKNGLVPPKLETSSTLFKEQLNALAGKPDDLTKLEILRLISRFN
jgi:hypothetical protein